MLKQTINYSNILEKLLQQRRVIGHLDFEVKDEDNFTKWYSLTENLVIKVFGPKSNHVEQLRDLYNKIRSKHDHSYEIESKLKSKEAKEKLKDLLTVFSEELKMDIESKSHYRKSKFQTKNILIANQTVNTNITINQIIEYIKENEPDSEKVKEAEVKLKELETELKQKSPTWAKIKSVLEWLLNFSRDAFLAVLPIILEQYKKQYHD